MTGIESSASGNVIESLSFSYDALNRPITRNADTFGYNDRSEVTSATISGVANGYDYDEIGNSTSYTPNSLNQYTEFDYDLDGNLPTDDSPCSMDIRLGKSVKNILNLCLQKTKKLYIIFSREVG